MDIIDHPSPNYGERSRDPVVELIVLHYTAMADAEAALTRLCDPACEVSSHYLIGRDGTLYCLVDEKMRAWHAGQGAWAGRSDVNTRSIGIELDNDGASAFDEPLLTTLEALLADIIERHKLPAKAVIGHSDMAPDRKRDPGPMFPWTRLVSKGLSIWPEPSIGESFLKDAEVFGYPVDKGENAVLAAFRQRFRPGATGPLSAADKSLMAGLARQYPYQRA